MSNNFKRNVIISYIVLFILLIIFVAISTINARKIESSTTNLVNQKLPGLIAASQLKHHLQEQTIRLYELYATNDHEAYKNHYAKNKAAILVVAANLQSLAEYKSSAVSIEKLTQQQDAIATKFVTVMTNNEVDWDAARAELSAFSNNSKLIENSLDSLITNVTTQTKQQAEVSNRHLEQLFNFGVIFVCLLFTGLSIMLYIVRRQKIVTNSN